MTLREEIVSISIQLSKKETTFQEAEKLFSEVEEKIKNAEQEEITEEVRKSVANIFLLFIGKIRDFFEE